MRLDQVYFICLLASSAIALARFLRSETPWSVRAIISWTMVGGLLGTAISMITFQTNATDNPPLCIGLGMIVGFITPAGAKGSAFAYEILKVLLKSKGVIPIL